MQNKHKYYGRFRISYNPNKAVKIFIVEENRSFLFFSWWKTVSLHSTLQEAFTCIDKKRK